MTTAMSIWINSFNSIMVFTYLISWIDPSRFIVTFNSIMVFTLQIVVVETQQPDYPLQFYYGFYETIMS